MGKYNVGPLSDVCWFINPMKTIVISTINHSYWSYLHQLSYPTGAPHCRMTFFWWLWIIPDHSLSTSPFKSRTSFVWFLNHVKYWSIFWAIRKICMTIRYWETKKMKVYEEDEAPEQVLKKNPWKFVIETKVFGRFSIASTQRSSLNITMAVNRFSRAEFNKPES